MPWKETNGQVFPEFLHSAALLSFCLASTAYDMELDPWREAGWRDISYQVDNTLLTGPSVNREANSGIASMITDYFQRLAQSRLSRQNPVSQIRGALRQKDGSDTCKAVVMLHKAPGNRYIVAIGFMGTGKRIYDWFSNFRVSNEEGMHAGFLQLTREFEKNGDEICFPETARELGRDKLTMNDILAECRRPGSRFRIWMAGHSQGGSIMQLFTLRQIRSGVLRQNMLGYGFASPTVIYENPGCDLTSFPLYHIINADDVFPRVGALLHVGRCRVFQPDETMRKACYRAAWREPVFRTMLTLTRRACDSGSAFLFVLSMLLALEDIAAEDAMTVLNGLIGHLIPDRLLGALGSRKEDLLRTLIQKTKQAYTRATGNPEPPNAMILPLRLALSRVIAQYGAKAFSKAFLQTLSLPHKLRGSDPERGVASYQYIVTRRFGDLRHRIWCASASRMDSSLVRIQKHTVPASRYSRLSREKYLRANR